MIEMTVWSKFTAWFSGWPESKERKQRRMEIDKLFEHQLIHLIEKNS